MLTSYLNIVMNIILESKYSTANIFLPYFVKIKLHLEQNTINSDFYICQMIIPIESKFDKY